MGILAMRCDAAAWKCKTSRNEVVGEVDRERVSVSV